MPGWLTELLSRLASAPELMVVLLLGLAAALENLLPPVPADTVVLFGGFLAGRGVASPWTIFLVVWTFNVVGALIVYAVGSRYGSRFFQGRWGRMLLRPGQLGTLDGLYRRRGFIVIFTSRFLPMFRAVVPVFAGVAGLGLGRVLLPIASASALWYGVLVYLGVAAGRNWERIARTVAEAGRWLWLVAALVAIAVGWWWWKSRREDGEE